MRKQIQDLKKDIKAIDRSTSDRLLGKPGGPSFGPADIKKKKAMDLVDELDVGARGRVIRGKRAKGEEDEVNVKALVPCCHRRTTPC
jgi:hypothetical protein